MKNQMAEKKDKKEQAIARLYELLDLQKKVAERFGDTGYNVFVFGSYITTRYIDGSSDIDIAIYSEDFGLYKRISLYLEEYFRQKGIDSDIFYIDISMEAPAYCIPLESEIQFTDYYPDKLIHFEKACRSRLEEAKARAAG